MGCFLICLLPCVLSLLQSPHTSTRLLFSVSGHVHHQHPASAIALWTPGARVGPPSPSRFSSGHALGGRVQGTVSARLHGNCSSFLSPSSVETAAKTTTPSSSALSLSSKEKDLPPGCSLRTHPVPALLRNVALELN